MENHGAEHYLGQAKSKSLWDLQGCLEPRQGMWRGLAPEKIILECQCRGHAEATTAPRSRAESQGTRVSHLPCAPETPNHF